MQFEEVFTVHVKITESCSLSNGEGGEVIMILFTGSVTGKYFNGTVLPGGVDTQVIGKNKGFHTLSARYMLQGKDNSGADCKIYIENNGNADNGDESKGILFRTYPKIITDSKALSFLNDDILLGDGRPVEGGVDITIYRLIV